MNLRPYKKIQQLEEEIARLQKENDELKTINDELKSENDEIQEYRYIEQTSDDSRIVFIVDTNLNVKTKTYINEEIKTPLLNNDFITENQFDDDMAHHLAMILISNDVTSQIISNFEKNRKREE